MRYLISFFALCSFTFLSGCTDPAIVDTNTALPGRNWSYVNRVKVPVTITDPGKAYAIFLNLRQTRNYPYSNIFILLRISGKGLSVKPERLEFRLAEPDGQWIGSGSGNLVMNQIPLKRVFRFPGKGTYLFEIEQNMRDNPLREVSDVGLRIEPVE